MKEKSLDHFYDADQPRQVCYWIAFFWAGMNLKINKKSDDPFLSIKRCTNRIIFLTGFSLKYYTIRSLKVLILLDNKFKI